MENHKLRLHLWSYEAFIHYLWRTEAHASFASPKTVYFRNQLKRRLSASCRDMVVMFRVCLSGYSVLFNWKVSALHSVWPAHVVAQRLQHLWSSEGFKGGSGSALAPRRVFAEPWYVWNSELLVISLSVLWCYFKAVIPNFFQFTAPLPNLWEPCGTFVKHFEHIETGTLG